jgi:predicted phage tail protein
VSPATSYSYRVRAFNGTVPSNYSNTLPVTTPQVPATPPTAPSNLRANNVTATAVPLTWQDKSTNETHFLLERAPSGGAFALLVTLPANTVSHIDATVSPATKYSYRLRAGNSGGNSAYTSTLNVTTPDVVPQPPSELKATAVPGRRIDLLWKDNSGNETGFEIERSTDGVKFSRIKTVNANITSYANTGLTAGRTYWYRVNAKNGVGDSAHSNTVQVTVLP